MMPYGIQQPSKGININVSLHITIHTGVLIKTVDGGWRHGALEWQHSAEAQGDDPWSEATRLVGRRRTEATSSYVVPPQGAYVCRSRGAWPYGMPHRFGPQRPCKGMNINGYLHITIQTGLLMETIAPLGAKVRWCSCNIQHSWPR